MEFRKDHSSNCHLHWSLKTLEKGIKARQKRERHIFISIISVSITYALTLWFSLKPFQNTNLEIVSPKKWKLTFGWVLRAVGGYLSHAGAVAAECHQARDDGGLAEADVAHDRHAAVGAGVGAVEVRVDLLEQPLPACEDRVHGDAGHLEQQRFEGDVLRPIRCKTHWRVRETEDYSYKPHLCT